MRVLIDGINFHVDVCGEGFPLLLLHGFTGDSATWTPFCPEWGVHSKLIIPDIIGHGKTELSDDLDRYKMERSAADLNSLLEQMEIKQVDILGYSMGGRLALTFAVLYPERVRKLILESASPGLQTEDERKLRCMKDEELAKFINEQGISSFVDHWEALPLFSTMNQLPHHIKEKIKNQRLSNNPRGLANSLLGMGTGSQPSWWDHLEQLTCEVMLLTGEKDEKFCDIAKRMKKKVKNASWVVFYDCGHAIHVEEVEKFGTIVSDFLNT
jgi:2-succinyl-6-hydroxy-2,4-cyclohexadiene-1-carboxylate synthase